MHGIFSHKKLFISIFFILFFSLVYNTLSTPNLNTVYAGVIGGDGDPPCGPPEFPPCPPGPTLQGPTNTPTPLPSNTPIPPTNAPPPTNTPTPQPTNTPIPPGNPTVTPILTPCPGPALCNIEIPTATPATPNICGSQCTIGQPNQCPLSQQCRCPDGSLVCDPGSLTTCQNPYCTSPANRSACQCTDCKCSNLSCNDTSSNPGKVIVIPRITPVNALVGPACGPTCEEYTINGIKYDCNEILTPQPKQFDKAQGRACKNYSIQVKSNGEWCGCTKQVCCPSCVAPVVMPGYDAGCIACPFETSIAGNPAACPCSATEITFDIESPGQMDFGNGQYESGTPNDPPRNTYEDAGFYEPTFSCTPQGGGSVQVCKKEMVVGCDCQNMNPSPTGSPTPTPTLGPWFKLKNASYSRQTNLVNLIPDPAISFDNGVEDLVCHDTLLPDYRCMLSREAGAEVVAGSIDLNGAPVSHRGWKQEDSIVSLDMSPAAYLDYVKAKKKYQILTKNDFDHFIPDVTLTSDKVYILDSPGYSPIRLDDTNFVGQTLPFVLIFISDVRIEKNLTPLESVSAALIVINDLKIANEVSELHGIFYTSILDFTYNMPSYPNPLKIKGNMISYQSTTTMNKRVNSPINAPGLFVIFDINKYLDLWPLLTTKEAIQQEEIQ